MKIKIILAITVLLLGVCLLAANFTPVATWPFMSLNAQRTGQNLSVSDIDGSKLKVEWMYPSISEDRDYRILSLESPEVTISGESWKSNQDADATVQANEDRIWSRNAKGPHFMYVHGSVTPPTVDYVNYSFSGLRPGDKYQIFMSVPCDLTENTNAYHLATREYVRVEFQNEAGEERAGEYGVNISREKYAGTWMYITGDLITVGKNGKIIVKISNRATVSGEIPRLDSDGNPIYDDDGNPVLDPVYEEQGLCLADAVRIVRVPERQLVGSPVSCSFPGDSFVLDNDDILYSPDSWVKAGNKFGMFTKNNSGQEFFHMTNTHPASVPLNGSMFVLKPDEGLNEPNRNFVYNFTVSENGNYELYANIIKFSSDIYYSQGEGFSSYRNYNTQTYKIYSGTTLLGTANIDMNNPGWNRLGVFSLRKDTPLSVVLDIPSMANLPEDSSAPFAYVADGITVTRVHDGADLSDTVKDIGATPVGVVAYNTKMKDTEIGRDWDEEFMSSIGLKEWGSVSAYQIKGNNEYWTYPNADYTAWDELEGPVNGFATSPSLIYMPDPKNSTETLLTAFVGDRDGIVYAFDVSGGNGGRLNANSRLLFKGPGIFLPEPLGVGGLYKGWKVSSLNSGAFGGSYIYTDSSDADPVRFVITDQMREKAGDLSVYDMNKNLTGFTGKSFSSWRWKIRFWVPPVEKSIGSRLKFTVKSFSSISSKEIETISYCTINKGDLGTWKYADVNASYYAPSEIKVTAEVQEDGVAIFDNIWLCPALPGGEDLDFTEGNEFVANVDQYAAAGTYSILKADMMYAPTAAGRIFAYALKDGVDEKNRIAKLAWTYPKLEDRKNDKMASGLSFTNSRLYFNARPYGGSNKLALYCIDTTAVENALVNRDMADYYKNAEPILVYSSPLDQIYLRSGIMNFMAETTGKGLSGSVFGFDGQFSDLNKLEHSDSANTGATLIDVQKSVSATETTPAVAFYGNPTETAAFQLTGNTDLLSKKILYNDITGYIHSYEMGGTNTPFSLSSNFVSPDSSKLQDKDVVSNIVTDGYIDNVKQLRPNAYFGSSDGYMTVFNSVTGERLIKIIAGMQADAEKRQVKGTPILISGADAEGESIVNLNGADGYNYTYNIHVYDTTKNRWRNDLAIGSNWEDLLDELEGQEVDPSVLEETNNIQFEMVDYSTAQNLISIFKKKDDADSTYKRIISDSKEELDKIPDTENTFIRKDMIVIPEEGWKFIQTGAKEGNVQNNKVENEEKLKRLGDYLLLEAQKCRTNRDFKGDKKVAGNNNDSRALFWDLDAQSGERDARQKGANVNLEWGDHLYFVLWNMPAGAKINGTAPIYFEYCNGRVPLSSRSAYSPSRKVPASVTKIYNFETYNVKFMDPLTNKEEEKVKFVTLGDNPNSRVSRKLSVIEVTLDCNHNKIQTMIGSGWKISVEVQLPNNSKTVRFPVASLKKGTLGSDINPALTTEESDWIQINPEGYREEFTINNPLSLSVGNKTYGKTYTRYSNGDTYNAVNGVRNDDLATVDLGDFHHGYLSAIKDVAKTANRSCEDIYSVRFEPGNHMAGETVLNGDETNYYSDPMPWEYGLGSADYPDIDYRNVEAYDQNDEDIIKSDVLLKAKKPWTEAEAKNPYINGRTGNVDFGGQLDVRYQIDVPQYQPAMKSYFATVVVYVDSNGNGRFDLSGSYENPGVDCEAHRRFLVDFGVSPNAEILVEEDDIYLGDAGHGLGYPLAINGLFTPYSEQALGLQTDGNGHLISYNPYNKKPEVMKWFKPFTVYNEGNVNLFDVSINKEPLFSRSANNNMSTFAEGILTSGYSDANYANMLRIYESNVVSSLDTVAQTDRTDGTVSEFFGAKYPFSSNGGNFGGASTSFTITKPRVGDAVGTTMTVPDTRKITGKPFSLNNDYNRKIDNNSFTLDVRDAQTPMVSVSVPIGQPIGEYATNHPMTVNAKFRSEGNVGTVTSVNGFNLNINVKEAQITGTPYDKNSAHASLYSVYGNSEGEALNYYAYRDNSDNSPFAFQRKNDVIGLLWSNNRIAEMEDIDPTEIQKARMPLNLGIAELKDVAKTEQDVIQTNETNNFYDRETWWNTASMSIKNNGWPSDLGDDYSVPVWNEDSKIKSSFLQYPSYYTDGNNEMIVFAGKAELAKNEEVSPNEFDNRIFYMDYSFTDSPEATPLSHLDTYTEKKYPVMFMRGGNNWFFWQSSLDGKSSISFTTNDIPNNYAEKVSGYCPEAKVRVPSAIASAGKPNIIDRNTGDNKIELIYTGVNKVTGSSDVYMSQYSLDVNSNDLKTFGLSEKGLPLTRVYDEMRRDPKFDFFVAKGLAWIRQDVSGTADRKDLPATVVGIGGSPDSENHEMYIDIFTGKNVLFKKSDWVNGNVNALPIFESLAAESDTVYP
ncbi:MAG: hypothetical protein KBT47_05500, partial [Armatimonadetes bacterium]|nr:hypothetical protein [Candidatus Hippobium faecium]